ncbi:hypothetical protein HDU96_010186 [Phlyctochytrium bullatum]|nr:hypothetical protein HDU96_010186 [Phlyctochytrium bullatum]
MVARLWEIYATDPSDSPAFVKQQKSIKVEIEETKRLQKQALGKGNAVFLGGLRSTAPCQLFAAAEVSELFNSFWKTGLTTFVPERISKAKHFNPMYAIVKDSAILHYGQDPLTGYHLSTALAELEESSPFLPDKTAKGLEKYTIAAKLQFAAWLKAFRAGLPKIIVRFCVADALAFCHVLQYQHVHGESAGAGWYRWTSTFSSLELDSDEYTPKTKQDFPAPTKFDVIDTSNLVDHLGGLNVLAAASPLLKANPSSAFFIELLVKREKFVEDYVQSLLCGDIPTVALLLGLVPIEYWTGATAVARSDAITDKLSIRDIGQSWFKMVWRSRGSLSMEWDAKELADLCYRLYLDMFLHDSWAHRIGEGLSNFARHHFHMYTRASLSVVLQAFHNLNAFDSTTFMTIFAETVLMDPKLNMGPHYIHELFVQCYLSGLISNIPLSSMFGLGAFDSLHANGGPLSRWKPLPKVICITLVVPRKKLEVFVRDKLAGTPIAHLFLRLASMKECFYPNLQTGFGKIRGSGQKFTDNYTLSVEDDPLGWKGNAPFIVSTLAPTKFLLEQPDLGITVGFQLHSSPTSLMQYGKHFGMALVIHQSTLESQDVFISRHRPNMTGHQITGAISLRPGIATSSDGTLAVLEASLNKERSRVSHITLRLNVLGDGGRKLLEGGAKVDVTQPTPFNVYFQLDGLSGLRKTVASPLPLLMKGTKVAIARKSHYIAFTAPVDSPSSFRLRPDSVFPTVFDESGMIQLRTLHRLDPSLFPVLDITSKNEWLNPHVGSSLTPVERSAMNKARAAGVDPQDLKLRLKESLHILFMRYTGIQGIGRHSTFNLHCESQGGVNVIIFVSALRLDPGNQSVVLDAAAIPLTYRILDRLGRYIPQLMESNPVHVKVSEEELVLWKHLLPAFAERCRTYPHRPDCEYRSSRSVPLSTAEGKPVLCSCGVGKFPSTFRSPKVPLWNEFKKYAVRVAISPCFSVPFEERAVDHGPSFAPTETSNILESTLRAAMAAMGMGAGGAGGAGTETRNEPTSTPKIIDLDEQKGLCFHCGLRAEGMKKCSKCKVVQYCSRECQVEDWKEHKQICGSLQKPSKNALTIMTLTPPSFPKPPLPPVARLLRISPTHQTTLAYDTLTDPTVPHLHLSALNDLHRYLHSSRILAPSFRKLKTSGSFWSSASSAGPRGGFADDKTVIVRDEADCERLGIGVEDVDGSTAAWAFEAAAWEWDPYLALLVNVMGDEEERFEFDVRKAAFQHFVARAGVVYPFDISDVPLPPAPGSGKTSEATGGGGSTSSLPGEEDPRAAELQRRFRGTQDRNKSDLISHYPLLSLYDQVARGERGGIWCFEEAVKVVDRILVLDSQGTPLQREVEKLVKEVRDVGRVTAFEQLRNLVGSVEAYERKKAAGTLLLAEEVATGGGPGGADEESGRRGDKGEKGRPTTSISKSKKASRTSFLGVF